MKKALAIFTAAMMLISAFSVAAAAEGEVPSPIAVYNFEDDGNLGKDVSGNKNSLSAKGTVNQTNGKYGKAASFNYEGALVASSDANGADFIDKIELSGSKQMTLMYWVKYSKADLESWNTEWGWRRIVSNGVDGSTGYGGFTMLGLVGDNIIVPSKINPACVFYTEIADTWNGGNWSTYPWTEDWVHVAWTVDLGTNPGRCLFYVNGTAIFDLSEKDISNGLVNLSRAFAIGANYFVDGESNEQFNQPFAGEIDDFYAFDKVLDADQIAYFMNNNYTVPEEPSVPTSDALTAVMPVAVVCAAAVIVLKKKILG